MSIINCPVCQGRMREVNKGGVLIDTCTRCRGVWLDRGELEKLSAMMGDISAESPLRARTHSRRIRRRFGGTAGLTTVTTMTFVIATAIDTKSTRSRSCRASWISSIDEIQGSLTREPVTMASAG